CPRVGGVWPIWRLARVCRWFEVAFPSDRAFVAQRRVDASSKSSLQRRLYSLHRRYDWLGADDPDRARFLRSSALVSSLALSYTTQRNKRNKRNKTGSWLVLFCAFCFFCALLCTTLEAEARQFSSSSLEYLVPLPVSSSATPLSVNWYIQTPGETDVAP